VSRGAPATAAAGSDAGAVAGAAVGAVSPVGAGSTNLFVTVKITVLELLVGESNVTSLPEAPQLASTPLSSQL
jgi:hypothetical protein